MKSKLTIATAALGLVAAFQPAPANATNIFISNTAFPYNEGNITLSNYGGGAVGTLAGQFVMTGNYGTSLGTPTFTLYGWCVDIPNHIGIGGVAVPYTTGPLTGAPVDNVVANDLPLSAAQVAKVASLAAYGDSQLANPATASDLISGAVQIAIWEVEYPTLVVSGGGSPDSLATIMNEVNTLLTTNLPAATGEALIDQTGDGQNWIEQQLFVVTTEPTTIAVLGLALAGLGVVRRRR